MVKNHTPFLFQSTLLARSRAQNFGHVIMLPIEQVEVNFSFCVAVLRKSSKNLRTSELLAK
jgi:hypothetical protein